MNIPTDSTDAREQRENAEVQAAAQARHDEVCIDGWLGEDDRDRVQACPVCRPWVWRRVCSTCSAPFAACANRRGARGRGCCPSCSHPPLPSLATVLATTRAAG